MKLKHTLGLLGVLILLLAGYWAMLHREKEVVREQLEAKRMFDFTPEQVVQLSIQQLDAPLTMAKRDEEAGGWAFLKPNHTITAYHPLWDRVATNLTVLMNERTITAQPEDLAQYGLAQPLLTVTAEVADKGPVRLDFGKLEPTQNYRYARMDEGAVFLVSKGAFFELNRPLKDLRHQFLLKSREEPLIYLEYARIWTGAQASQMEAPPELGEESDVRVMISREDPDSPWRMLQPTEAAVDQEAAKALTDELQFAVVERFIDLPEDLSDYGLKPPRCRISVQDARGGDTQILYIGGIDHLEGTGSIFIKRVDCDSVFLVSPHLMTLLPEKPDTLREHRLVSRDAMDLQSVHYHRKEQEYTFLKDPAEGWSLEGMLPADANKIAISYFISTLQEMRCASFYPGTPQDYHLGEPELELTLAYAQGEAVHLRFWPHPADHGSYYALQDTGALVMVYRNFLERLFAPRKNYLTRELLRFNKLGAARVDMQFEGTTYRFEKIHDKWVVQTPENKVLTYQSDMDTLLDALTPLKATDIIETPDADRSAYGLTQPQLVLHIGVEKEEEPGQLDTLGPLTVGVTTDKETPQHYVTTSLRDGVYLVSHNLIEAVREMLRGVKDRV